MAIPETEQERVFSTTPVEEFIAELQPMAFGLLYHYNIPAEDAEDILHDTLLIYLRRQPRVEKPINWVLGTLRNRCLMFWRDRQRRPYLAVDSHILEALASPLAPQQETALAFKEAQESLARLPQRNQEVLHSHLVLGHTPRETARLLGYKDSGIYQIIQRSLTRLVERMATDGVALMGARG